MENKEAFYDALRQIQCNQFTPNEYGVFTVNYGTNHAIDLVLTVNLSIRICLRVVNTRPIAVQGYEINWCIGKRWDLIAPLVNFIQDCIDEKREEKLPFNSHVKPLYNDMEFSLKLRQLGFEMPVTNEELLSTNR